MKKCIIINANHFYLGGEILVNYKGILLLIIVISLVWLTGCGPEEEATAEKKLKIVTTLFPQYDFTSKIAGDKAEVSILLPPGVEPHSFEPTPQDMVQIKKADLFIYTGAEMEPWAQRIIESTKGSKLAVINVSEGINLIETREAETNKAGAEEEHHHHHEAAAHEEHEEEEEHDEDHHHGKDPHIWLDPLYAQKIVDQIVAGLVKIDGDNQAFYLKNGAAYKQKLADLHQEFLNTFSKVKTKQIIYGGHFVFGYFAKRYDLQFITPYHSFAPDAEPTPRQISEIIKKMQTSGSKVIYYEELIEPKVARVIAKQTGAKMLLLHGLHNLSKEEMQKGFSYLKIMKQNLQNLRQGLDYQEN